MRVFVLYTCIQAKLVLWSQVAILKDQLCLNTRVVVIDLF